MDALGRQERAWYAIRVRGVLAVDWGRWFPGLSVAHELDGDVVLSGEVTDRAAFYGMVSRARDLGLMVISVERREVERRE